jgi:lipoprotein-anchoring transpeptidase ErfK/SrfK
MGVNKNIIRISAIAASAVLAIILLRWVMVSAPFGKKITGPERIPVSVKKESAFVKKAKELLEEGQKAEAVRQLEEIIAAQPGSQHAYESIILLADIYNKDGNPVKAKELYLIATKDYSDYCDYSDIQDKLTALNMQILFSPIPSESSQIYEVKSGDSLTRIAKRFSTTTALIKRANGLETDLIRPGMKLKVQKQPFSVIVDKSQSTLTLISGGEIIKVYNVSTGKNNSTPVGVFKIKDKLIDPVWYSEGAVVPADSPENVLGTRWMGLTTDEPGYGIHGTTEPESIGYQCTEGCVRMYNAEVEELFDIVPEGTEVTIID